MASHLSVSLSESIQASLIIQHQEERKNRHTLTKQTSRQSTLDSNVELLPKEESEKCHGIPLYQQCLLVMVFAGIEMCATFTLIYSILFLQFLGVPTSLVTVEGVIAGTASIIFLPISGYYADRGSNLVFRKMRMSLISLTMYFLGFCGLAACCAARLDLNTPSNYDNKTLDNFNLSDITGSTQLPTLTMTTLETRDQVTDSLLPYNSNLDLPIYEPSTDKHHDHNFSDISSRLSKAGPEGSYLGPIQVVGMLSTSLLDMGFDTGMTLCRAFILEASPPSIHNKLLIMATIFSSFGGLAFALIGTFDFPTTLRSTFNVDGTAATVLMFSCGILIFMIISFSITLLTGYFVYRNRQRRLGHNVSQTASRRFDSESSLHHNDKLGNSIRPDLLARSNNSISESSKTLTENDETSPLTQAAHDNKTYSSMPTSSVGESDHRPHTGYYKGDGLDIRQYQKILSPWDHNPNNTIHEGRELNISATTKPVMTKHKDDDDNIIIDDTGNECEEEDKEYVETYLSDNETRDDSYNEDDDEKLQEENENEEYGRSEISDIYAAMRASYSMSVSTVYSSILGEAHNRKHASKNKTIMRQHSKSMDEPSIWRSKRLKFLLVSIFFTMGANLSFSTYSGNTLTIGVFHGDPLALEGTQERENYNRGLRAVAMGNLITYSGFSIVCLMNKKIIDVIGEKSYFVASQAAYIALIVAFTVAEKLQTYFVACTVSGFYRGCAFTLGYIMVNKLVKEETSKTTGDKPTKNIGRIMALTGFLLPSKYVILSILVGPLMAALDSVWISMVIAAVDSGLALSVFCLFLAAKS